MVMPLMRLDLARERLDPHADTLLVATFKTAVQQWNTLLSEQPAMASAFTATTRANIIHDLTCRAVRGALSSCKNVREIKALGFFALAIGDDIIVRFKYVPTGMPNNVSTIQQELLAKQQYNEEVIAQLNMEGIPNPPTIVTCGYLLGDDNQIKRVSVQCDYYKSPYWKYLLFGETGEGGAGSFEILPINPTLAPATGVVVRSKSPAEVETQRDVGD